MKLEKLYEKKIKLFELPDLDTTKNPESKDDSNLFLEPLKKDYPEYNFKFETIEGFFEYQEKPRLIYDNSEGKYYFEITREIKVKENLPFKSLKLSLKLNYFEIIFKSLILGALVTIVVWFPFILFFSRTIINPIINLSKGAKKALKESGLKIPNYSPFDANLVRIIELVHCIEKAIEIIENIKIKDERKKFNFSKLNKSVYEGAAVTEAPRGILYHSYKISRNGTVIDADIITPTAKNLLSIETDIWNLLPGVIAQPRNKIVKGLEELVRSYDPCISCATHFLEVKFL